MLRSLIKKAAQVDSFLKKGEEGQYLSLINELLKTRNVEVGRNGETLADFGASMVFSLENGKLPLLTTKKVAWKTCLRELLWFISGSTDNDELKKKNVKIWNLNATREFLDSRGLNHLEEGDLGPVYGHQWRHFNAEYGSRHDDYSGKGVDQLAYIIENLKDPSKRVSRRMVMSAWNPCQIDQMALPPCHVLCQFNVLEGKKLSCSLYQRSGDVGLGVPFNIASYSFLTHLLAKHCDLEPYEFVYYLGNCHIYSDHCDALTLQIEREPFDFPTLKIGNKRKSIDDYVETDFDVVGYQCHETVKMQMRQ
jgi:thymidylate synthase